MLHLSSLPVDEKGMRAVVLQPPEQRWVCPNCAATDVTHESQPHTRFHVCLPLGLTAPMVPAGINCKVEAVEREDYVGNDLPQYNREGRPIMAVVTTRDDGQDCAVLAPTARNRD